jgi:hypothetical protein
MTQSTAVTLRWRDADPDRVEPAHDTRAGQRLLSGEPGAALFIDRFYEFLTLAPRDRVADIDDMEGVGGHEVSKVFAESDALGRAVEVRARREQLEIQGRDGSGGNGLTVDLAGLIRDPNPIRGQFPDRRQGQDAAGGARDGSGSIATGAQVPLVLDRRRAVGADRQFGSVPEKDSLSLGRPEHV